MTSTKKWFKSGEIILISFPFSDFANEKINFPKKSFVRIHKIFTLDKKQIVKNLGILSPTFLKQLKSECLTFLKK